MAKRISSRQFVTVFVSLIVSFAVQAADLTIGYQTGIDPSKVPQADGAYEKAIGEKIAWRRFNSGPEDRNGHRLRRCANRATSGPAPWQLLPRAIYPSSRSSVSAQINSSEALVSSQRQRHG